MFLSLYLKRFIQFIGKTALKNMILNSKIYADVTTKCRVQSLRPVCSFVVAPALPKYLFHQRNVHFKIKMVLFEICCL